MASMKIMLDATNQPQYLTAEDKIKQRSERASSLALTHSSLLDLLDKQQEQCNSVALLPINANGVVRRHSSHYCPMLQNEEQQQLQSHSFVSQQQTITHSALDHRQQQQDPNDTYQINENIKSILSSISGLDNSFANFNDLELHKSQIQHQEHQQLNTATIKTNAYNKNPNQQQLNSAQLASPPPIPRRTFRNKYTWNNQVPAATGTLGASPSALPVNGTFTAPTQLLNKDKQQITGGCSFIQPQIPIHNKNNIGGGSNSSTAAFFGNSQLEPPTVAASSLFVDLNSRTLFASTDAISGIGECLVTAGGNIGFDTGGMSDDDRMSLENSVFEESLNSTPVKKSSHTHSSLSKLFNGTFSTKTLSALTQGDISDALKRSNRSSSSTVDSSITSSSGYGSSGGHNERLASTSTTADFRSRFSSVDTQSSLDNCLTEKTSMDSPLSKETCFKAECNLNLNEIALLNLNNNETTENHMITHNNNNLLHNYTGKLPAVPMRMPKKISKQSATPAVMPQINFQSQSEQSLNNSIDSSNKASSTVPNSTSTSSTASAGSSISTGSSMSISGNSGSGSSPQQNNSSMAQQFQQQQQQKRPPIPPIPPTRVQHFEKHDATSNLKNNTQQQQASLTIRNQLNRSKRPPPIQYPKLHQRQDSNLSSDSYSMISSPGYNSKNLMDAPLLQNAARMNETKVPGMTMVSNKGSNESFSMSTSTSLARFGGGGAGVPIPPRQKFNFRQDSTISSDSFSQTSSPGYNTKIMEAPLLASSLNVKRLCNVPTPINIKKKFQAETIDEVDNNVPMSPLTKCVSTPASLQTIVRFQNGSPNTMSLPHQIISRRKSSNPYITNGRLKFRLFQILINALALLAIAGGLAAYFNAYPTIKFVNKTIINTVHLEDPNLSYLGKNPAPGTCLPIIVKFCQGPQIPYNFTVFPNYIGHFGQLETQVDMDAYEALVDVRCYELVSLFLCTLFVPKCGATGATVPPCKSLCTETMRRCGFFFDVFGLTLPEYLNCKLFKDGLHPEDCVGFEQVQNVMIAAANPKCDGYKCDNNRCIPPEYVCDGNLDCMDQTDEHNCTQCATKDELFCGHGRCISSEHICNGVMDCPFGQDEKNCIRLSDRNGDLGKGVLEVYRISTREWSPACVKNWDRAVSPSAVCSLLGYSAVNATSVITQKTHRPLLTSVNISTDIWKMYAKKKSNLMKEFLNCTPDEDYPIAELTCSSYVCGTVKRTKRQPSRRIIGGSLAHPGSWPFLAAILGGPEKIFYCAGVLISDQWVLTASHCIGNHTVIDLEDWTIQLGVTRRNSYTYSSQEVKVKTVIPHPLYNTVITHDNDIALFQLAKRVAFHEHLLPVCLPPPNMKQLLPNSMCTVIGWGKRKDKDPTATYEPIVNEVHVPIIQRQLCDEWLDNLTISEGMICAGYEEGGRDACQGDSGGPLLCPYPGEKDRWFVGGIVSWGIMCAHPKLPGVYANVMKYIPWIQEQIQKYSKDETYSKYDSHPGGPDILSNLATVPLSGKNRHSFKLQNQIPVDMDFYDSSEKH